MNSSPLRGLYAITSTALCSDRTRLLAGVRAALRGGAVLIQYRNKPADAAQRRADARALATCCHDYGARLIVNDDAELAHAAGADGVHLGAADGALTQARAQLGPQAIIGASCAGSVPRAQAALTAGASYVAFGRFFVSQTKPDAPPAAVEWLAEARAAVSAPICAIGGVTPDNGALLLAAGADLLAAVDGVFGDTTPDVIERRARAYCALFQAD